MTGLRSRTLEEPAAVSTEEATAGGEVRASEDIVRVISNAKEEGEDGEDDEDDGGKARSGVD